MFIGHFGIGFGAKRVAPTLSLGTAFLSAQFVDLLWPTLLLLGLEQVEIVPGITQVTPLDFTYYPISHSFLAVILWAMLFAIVYGVLRKSTRGAVVCGLAVVSHWLLDFITHRPDLPLYPGGTFRAGLGLWNSLWATVVVEGIVFGVGVWLYLRTTRALDRKGVVGLWVLLSLLAVIYLANILGTPPPSAEAIAWVGQSQWLLIAWGYWLDRHRQVVAVA